jgi:dihydropteroate synthase
MHMAGEPATMQDNPSYDNVVREVEEFLLERGEAASAAGVNEVWIDPGFGFGKTLDQNVQLVASLDSFTAQRFPVVLGVSRKNSLGRLAARADTGRDEPVTGPQDRLEPALAMGVWAALSGVDMLRVHDVAPHVRALRVVESTTELPVRSGLMTVEPPALGAA